TLDGGQSFRWSPVSRPATGVGVETDAHHLWTGTWSGCVAQLRLNLGTLEWRAPTALQKNVATALPHYLGLDRDWSALTDALPWRSDAHLAQCLEAFPGLRLLRQPF